MYNTREISLDAMRKPARNKGKHTEGQSTEISGSAWERNWVVGLQILTTTCCVRIMKESGHSWEQRAEGRERIWLIAIDYYTATGTARMEYRKTKGQRWPDDQSPKQTPVALWETQG